MNSILEFFGFKEKKTEKKSEKKTSHKVDNIVNITVWSLEGCSHCIMLKKWLKENNWKFVEKSIRKGNNLKELQKLLTKSNVKTTSAPQVFINGKYIGGVKDSITYLKKLRV